jgi:DNA-binding NarL/FixJ family response regulator
MPIRVLLVDDNALFREGIAQILQKDGRFAVIGQASRGDEAVAATTRLHPDLILIDVQMPGMSGIEAIRQIRVNDADVGIGVLTMYETPDYVQSAMKAGASGYVAKDSTPADLCEAAMALAKALAALTPRELEVLRALTGSESPMTIARSLGISPRTLRNHISHTYHKLGVSDRAQAVIVALREGLVESPPA